MIRKFLTAAMVGGLYILPAAFIAGCHHHHHDDDDVVVVHDDDWYRGHGWHRDPDWHDDGRHDPDRGWRHDDR